MRSKTFLDSGMKLVPQEWISNVWERMVWRGAGLGSVDWNVATMLFSAVMSRVCQFSTGCIEEARSFDWRLFGRATVGRNRIRDSFWQFAKKRAGGYALCNTNHEELSYCTYILVDFWCFQRMQIHDGVQYDILFSPSLESKWNRGWETMKWTWLHHPIRDGGQMSPAMTLEIRH